jgi:hypothetical protein
MAFRSDPSPNRIILSRQDSLMVREFPASMHEVD